MSSEQKELDKVAKKIAACKICRKNKIGISVAGAGNPNAKVMLIGEAPGKKEAVAGQPFIGAAGKVLTAMLEKAGLAREDVFITSPVKFLPKHGTPRPDEVLHGMVHTRKQVEIIKPKVIVLMGRIACLGFLERSCAVAQEHGKIEIKNGVKHLITFHPAAPLYSPKVRAELVKDFKKVKRLING